MKLPVLPVYYYLDHFTEMLGFVERTYEPVLGPQHHAFIALFRGFSRDAQCLLIRMINRRGYVFRPSAFKYGEIGNVASALDELRVSGLARALRDDDYAAFLSTLSKNSLLQAGKAIDAVAVRSTWSKPRLVDHFVDTIPFAAALDRCGGTDYVALDNLAPIHFLLYLYFGKTERDLKNFTLRDLGIIRTNKLTSFSARFSDGEEAYACFHYSQILNRLETKSAAVFTRAVDDVLDGPRAASEHVGDLRDRAAYLVGQFFEKRGDKATADRLYRAGSSAECNERLVRLLYTGGDKASAEELLRHMIDDPASDDEYLFATDFHARKFGGQRTGACTELLRSGRTLTVDDIRRANPEAGVAGVMRRDGWRVFYSENCLWRSLFGLLFWDELFESGQLHSGFDWVPQCLKDRSFKRRFDAQIASKLNALRTGAGLPLILRTIAAKWGTPNGVFGWDRVNAEALRALLQTANPNAIATVTAAMCQDYVGMHDGFPDLMLVRHSELLFLEVKAEGDAVRRNQLTRLRQLKNAGINAEIARVAYRFDPEQEYVVVDIETTGSWGNGDRITEIGAVKMRNHRVIDEWHSLINPQRLIPHRITQLTGITNAMVRDAPLFAEIADSFRAFMGEDAIFVAHSVNFDYGFIAAEFDRLGRRFRYPKLCTCAGMRRSHPGHKSYSLGNLCQAYEISLEDHHRALCDARAAAQLLNLINGKRGQERPTVETAAA
ncbi:exonuclease domain-containing protein [uncultured Bradyrhizobium sp.]|uniref:exonuclease domain-containing protein n=1 Tax=uncultured Bradyrhizobium sp. TaxID=199684 RepID=UPI0035CCA493